MAVKTFGQSDSLSFKQSPGKQRNGPTTDGPPADQAYSVCVLGLGVKAGFCPYILTGGGAQSETLYRKETRFAYTDYITEEDEIGVVSYERREWTRVDEVDEYLGEIKSIVITDNKGAGRTLFDYSVASDGTVTETRHANFPSSHVSTAAIIADTAYIDSADDYPIGQSFFAVSFFEPDYDTHTATLVEYETSGVHALSSGGSATLYLGHQRELSLPRTTADAKTDALAALDDVDLTEPTNLTTPETYSLYNFSYTGQYGAEGYVSLILHPCDEDDVADKDYYFGLQGNVWEIPNIGYIRSRYERGSTWARKLAMTNSIPLNFDTGFESPTGGISETGPVEDTTTIFFGQGVAAWRGVIGQLTSASAPKSTPSPSWFVRTWYLASAFKVCLNRLRHYYDDDVEEGRGTNGAFDGTWDWNNSTLQTVATKDGDDIGISLDPPDVSDTRYEFIPGLFIGNKTDWEERWLVGDQDLIDDEHGSGVDQVGVGVMWGS